MILKKNVYLIFQNWDICNFDNLYKDTQLNDNKYVSKSIRQYISIIMYPYT